MSFKQPSSSLGIFSSFLKAQDLQKRLFFTLAVLVVYRLGTYIPLPGVNPLAMMGIIKENAGGLLGMLDLFSGGSLSRMTIMALNLMPYISASIIVQLLTSIVPSMEALRKEGESGRKKLNQYTRYGAVGLAAFQGYAAAVVLEKVQDVVIDPGFLFRFSTVLTLVGATLFLMWLGEQITSRGLGNGTSIIIFSGIVANLPQMVLKIIDFGRTGALSVGAVGTIFVGVALMIAFIVFMERSHFRLPIQYPKKQIGQHLFPGEKTYMPIKLNNTGVLPPIFASSLLVVPSMVLSSLIGPESSYQYLLQYLSHGSLVFSSLYAFLIVFFSFFYTTLVFNSEEVAENLRKNGGFVPGYRPGPSTAQYLDKVLMRLTVLGCSYLLLICVIPEMAISFGQLGFYLGGTSLLIVVSVTLDTFAQVQAHLMSHKYELLLKKGYAKFIR